MDETEIRAAVEYLEAVLRDMDERAAGQALSAEDQARFDEGLALRNTRKAELEGILARRTAVAGLGAVPANVERGSTGPAFIDRTGDPYDLSEIRTLGVAPREVRRQLHDQALRAIEAAPFTKDEHRDAAEQLLRRSDNKHGDLARHMLGTGSEAYRSAWTKKLTGDDDFTSEERQALALERAMSTTAANGGYAIPFMLDPTLVLTNAGTTNPLRQISTIKKLVGSNIWHGVSTAGADASYDAEAAQVSDDSPTLAQPTIQTEKAQVFVQATIEAFEDIANLGEDVVLLFNDSKDRLEATKFTVGAGHGSTEPKGVITAVAAVAGSRVASATADVYAVADTYAVQNALPARHRRNASWMAQLATFNASRQFATLSQYAGFWVDRGGNLPPLMLDRPTYEAEDMDGVVDASANNDILLYGDFAKFYIVDRVGMSVEFIPHVFGANGRPTGQRGWYAYWRNGSDVVDANAFRLLRA